jgi:hypothetical protein
MFPISNFILPDNFGKQVSFCATEQNSNDRHDVATNNTLSSLLTTHQQAHVMAMMTGVSQHLAWSPGTTFHHEKGVGGTALLPPCLHHGNGPFDSTAIGQQFPNIGSIITS